MEDQAAPTRDTSLSDSVSLISYTAFHPQAAETRRKIIYLPPLPSHLVTTTNPHHYGKYSHPQPSHGHTTTMTRPPLSALTKLPVPSKARDEIAHLDALLAAFNHRNRNQHRLSPWWSRFSILRRALRGLSRGGNSDAVPREDVVWLRDAIVPRCYVYAVFAM